MREAAQKFLIKQKKPAVNEMMAAFDDLNLEGKFRGIAVLRQHYLVSEDDVEIEKAFTVIMKNNTFKKYIQRIMAEKNVWRNNTALPARERQILHQVYAAAQHNHFQQGDRTLNWLPYDHVVPILTSHLRDVFYL